MINCIISFRRPDLDTLDPEGRQEIYRMLGGSQRQKLCSHSHDSIVEQSSEECGR